MKLLYLTFLLLLIGSCAGSESSETIVEDTEPTGDIEFHPPPLEFYDHYIWFDKSTGILSFSKNDKEYLTDTILGLKELPDLSQKDINGDSYEDVSLGVYDTTDVYEYWYVYEAISGTFKKVQGLDRIVAAESLPDHPSYFYTYTMSNDGCDCENCTSEKWSSTLLKVRGNELSILGRVSYEDCLNQLSGEDDPDVVYAHYVKGTLDSLEEEMEYEVTIEMTFEKFQNAAFVLFEEDPKVKDSFTSQGYLQIDKYWIDHLVKYEN
ncbi:hypothetical protein JYT74_01780 [Crocinitomix catalasitica]|nr:hypothetical protein [Crocinitomix catalasitica]